MVDFSRVSYWNISSLNRDVVQVSDSNNRVIWRCMLRDDEPLAFNNLGDQSNYVWVVTNESLSYEAPLTLTLYYSYNMDNWGSITVTPGYQNTTIPFTDDNGNTHSKIYIRHTGPMARISGQNIIRIELGSDQDTYLTGNILSLIGGESFQSSSLSRHCLASIGFDGVVSAEQVVFPNTTEIGCYQNMFIGNNTLLRAPILPATVLAQSCYQSMFSSCTSLTTAPELPATTLVERCYYGMFYGCTNLNYIKCLATNISASNCTNNWVSGVASTGTFVTPNQSIWTTGINGIPSGWTVLSA